MSDKLKYILLYSVIVSTATLLVMEWWLGMAGITAFTLAYLSKGMRRSLMKTNPFRGNRNGMNGDLY